jgi:uncharacterized protein (DUF433 family)
VQRRPATPHPPPPRPPASNNLNRKAIIKQNAKEALALAAKTIGISPAELVKDLAQGKSIAQVATDHSVQPSAVISALVTAADAKVTAALNAHKITQAQATKLDARIPTVVANFVNKPHPRAVRADLRDLRKDAVQIAAKTIGIPAKQLVSEVKGGKTVAQVAADHGSSGQAVITALTTAIEKKIDALVAAHKLTPAQGQALEAKVPAKVANFVNNWHPKK